VISLAALGVAFFETLGRRRESAELRKRIARQERAHLGARQQEAHLWAEEETYVFTVTNAGPAVARYVVARIVEVDAETKLTDDVAVEHVKTAIPVGGEVTIGLNVPARFRDAALELRASWSDDRGDHSDEWLLDLKHPREEYRQFP
jgi:hypothetical protein